MSTFRSAPSAGPTNPAGPTTAGEAPFLGPLQALGPGLITGASDDDPSGIATYAQAGGKLRYSLLWASLVTLPLMACVQEICDRTALATGRGLGELAAQRTRGWSKVIFGVLLAALVGANTLNIAADLMAIGSGMNLLHLGPMTAWALIAGVLIAALMGLGSFHRVALIFKLLCLALVAYIAVLFVAHPPWRTVINQTLLPHIHMSSEYLGLMVAVLGTTISPYLFFWQSAHRIEDLRDEPVGGTAAVALPRWPDDDAAQRKQRFSRFDVFAGMALSNIVMFAIIVASAATLGQQPHNDVGSPTEAAQALKPLLGSSAQALFALGFIGTGFLAVPILAGSAAAGLSGLFHQRWGFSRSPRRAPVFYGLVAVGTIGGMLLSLVHADPIKLLVYVAEINGIAAAPFLVVLMLISRDPTIMGHYRNGRVATVLGWVTTVIMGVAAITFFVVGP